MPVVTKFRWNFLIGGYSGTMHEIAAGSEL